MLKRALTENLKRWWVRISKTTQNTGLNCRGQMPQTSQIPGGLFPKESLKPKGHIMNT